MQAPDQSFALPMMLTFLESNNGKHVAHSLDFDIVAVGDNEDDAWGKLRLAVKTYVEYGLSNGWKDHIMFPAPQEFWDKITPDMVTRILEPITLGDAEKKVVAVHEPGNDSSLRAAG